MCSSTQGVPLNLNGNFLLQACLLQFQTWVPPWVPCPLLCLWCSQWVLEIEEWCVVYQRETTLYLHHHTLTWRAAISDTFYLVSALVLMDGNSKSNCFKSCLFLSWSRHDWHFDRAVVAPEFVWRLLCHLHTFIFRYLFLYLCMKRIAGHFLFKPNLWLLLGLTENKACLVSVSNGL